MKSYILFGMLVCVLSVWSCDICGGVGSNATIGLFASNRFHTAGLRTQYTQYSTYSNGNIHSNEYISLFELHTRFQLGKKCQLFIFQPYQIALQKRMLGQTAIKGFGDPTFLSNFTVIDRKDSNQVTRFFMTLGSGFKFPFGKNTSSQDPFRNLYPGTGAFELLFLQTVTHRPFRYSGWQTENSIALKGKNKEGFANGHSWQLTSVWFWDLRVKAYRLFPAMGFTAEHFGSNRSIDQVQSTFNGKGQRFSGRIQVNLFTRRFLFSLGGSIPFYQNINDGQNKLKYQVSLSGQYIFPFKNKKI